MAFPAQHLDSWEEAYRLSGGRRSEWLTGLQRWDPVTFVLLVHAGVLLVLDRVVHPWAATVATVGFGVWRLGLGLAIRRGSLRGEGWDLLREGGSLVLTAGLIAADGGTESPFFFWTVIILAWQTMVYPLRAFTRLALAGVAIYAWLSTWS